MKFMTYWEKEREGAYSILNENVVFGIDFILRCDLGISKLAK